MRKTFKNVFCDIRISGYNIQDVIKVDDIGLICQGYRSVKGVGTVVVICQ